MSVTRDSKELHEARQHLQQAAIIAQVGEDRKRGARRLRLGRETGDRSIPPGAWVHFKPAVLHNLKPGTLVLVRSGSELVVRRLIRLAHESATLLMHVGPPSGGPAEAPLHSRHLLGQVTCLEIDGKTYELQVQGGSPVLNWLTDYGTCSPGQKMVKILAGFLPPRFRPGLR